VWFVRGLARDFIRGLILIDGNYKAFKIGATAIPNGARVKLASGLLVVAVATDKELGTLVGNGDIGAHGTVKLRTASGTHTMIANGALAVGATGFTAAAGKIGATSTGAFQAVTVLEASSADGDLIEVLYNAHGDTAAS